MARFKRFTFLCNAEERRILAALAKQLQRSQSDAVRWLIRGAASELHTEQPVPALQSAPEAEADHAPA